MAYESKEYKIKVVFSNEDLKKLPISHTCFLTIEIPKYKTFNDMKTKMDIALKMGSEGFGFA